MRYGGTSTEGRARARKALQAWQDAGDRASLEAVCEQLKLSSVGAPEELRARCVRKVDSHSAVFEMNTQPQKITNFFRSASLDATDDGTQDVRSEPKPEIIHAEPVPEPTVDAHALSREILEDIVESALDKVMQKHVVPAPAAGAGSFASAGEVKTFDDEYVPELKLPGKGTLLIDSDCGLGKTTQLVSLQEHVRDLLLSLSSALLPLLQVRPRSGSTPKLA